MCLTDNIEILPLKEEHLPLLQKLAKTTFFETFEAFNTKENMRLYEENQLALSQLKAEFDNLESNFFILWNNEQPIAYLKLNFGEAQQVNFEHNYCELERIYVLASQQGRGIGKKLLDFAFTFSKGKGHKHLWLGVWEHNRKALDFYKQAGFEVFDQKKFILGTDEQTDFLMKITL